MSGSCGVVGFRRRGHWRGTLGVVVLCVALMVACSSNERAGTPARGKVDPGADDAGVGASTSSSLGALVDGASGFATSGDLRIHYEVFGEGRPLVLVHGWSASIEFNWKQPGWIDALKSERQVIAIDIRGHGDSDKPHDPAAYGYAAMSEDVIAVMDHLGVKRADFVGYSLGADVGAVLMGHDAGRFTSFVLMGIGDEDDESLAMAPRIAAALRADDPSEVTDQEALLYRRIVDLDPRNDREALAVAALEMWPQGYPLKLIGDRVGDVAVPVLILNGANDVPYVATDDKLSAAIPGARLVEIPDADHLSVVIDPRFREEVLRFLREQ